MPVAAAAGLEQQSILLGLALLTLPLLDGLRSLCLLGLEEQAAQQ
jgi:hypothetical protein